MNASARILSNQLRELHKEPIEGFYCELADESDLYNWTVYLKGPGETAYEGGIYRASLLFPDDYPYSPPKMKFLSEILHPNIYENGDVCISILHQPGEDAMSGERPEERWTAVQTPSTILLSVLSMLSDPNIYSAANVDAAKDWRDNRSLFNSKNLKLCKKSLTELPPNFKMPEPKKYVPPPSEDIDMDDDNVEYEIDVDEDEEEIDLDDENLDDIDLENLTDEERKLLEEEGVSLEDME
jgi:ubiquitin-protein ligase